MTTKSQATIEDLYKVPGDGKAEIVNGELVQMAPTGYLPGYAAGEIFASLRGAVVVWDVDLLGPDVLRS